MQKEKHMSKYTELHEKLLRIQEQREELDEIEAAILTEIFTLEHCKHDRVSSLGSNTLCCLDCEQVLQT